MRRQRCLCLCLPREICVMVQPSFHHHLPASLDELPPVKQRTPRDRKPQAALGKSIFCRKDFLLAQSARNEAARKNAQESTLAKAARSSATPLRAAAVRRAISGEEKTPAPEQPPGSRCTLRSRSAGRSAQPGDREACEQPRARAEEAVAPTRSQTSAHQAQTPVRRSAAQRSHRLGKPARQHRVRRRGRLVGLSVSRRV